MSQIITSINVSDLFSLQVIKLVVYYSDQPQLCISFLFTLGRLIVPIYGHLVF